MNKTELLDAMRRDRADLDSLVESLTEPQITDPALDGGWSVKDVLAHISLWEALCAGWLDEVAQGRTPARSEVRDVDATNARAYEAAKNLALAEVLSDATRSYKALVAAVEALSDADLADETRLGWPAWQMASGNSDEHYREHAEAIRASLDKT